MGSIIYFLLIIVILYFAMKYLKGPRNTNTDSDGFTTHPFTSGTDEFNEMQRKAREDGETTEQLREADSGLNEATGEDLNEEVNDEMLYEDYGTGNGADGCTDDSAADSVGEGPDSSADDSSAADSGTNDDN